MNNLWTNSKLLTLEFSLRKKIKFHAPLLYSLDFHGVDPVVYTRAGTFGAIYRDGGTHTVAADAPIFEWDNDLPLGLWLASPATLQYAAGNGLSSADTIIWFENDLPKSTPTQGVPFDGSGNWAGNLDIHLKHIVKANTVLSNTEINQIQTALMATAQVIPEPPAPPVNPAGSFITETPSGTRNGSNTVFTLSQKPDLNSLLVFCFGAGALERVGSSPGNFEFTAGGTDNKTLTLGLAPTTGYPFVAQYVVAP